MSKSHIFSLLLASIYLSSCIRMGDNGYQQLSDSQKSKIVTCTSPIDSLCYDGNIYLVSIEQMREHVNRHKTLVIYEFGAYCHGDNCISPQMAESICRKKAMISVCCLTVMIIYCSFLQQKYLSWLLILRPTV